jgi:hypothetical protein
VQCGGSGGVLEHDDALGVAAPGAGELDGAYAGVGEQGQDVLFGCVQGALPFVADDCVQHDHVGRIDVVSGGVGEHLDQVGGTVHAQTPAHHERSAAPLRLSSLVRWESGQRQLPLRGHESGPVLVVRARRVASYSS